MHATRFSDMFAGFDPIAVRRSITAFLQKEWETHLKKREIVLGLSGGIDSALAAALITEAGLPLTVMMLPDGYRPDSDSIVTARQMIDWLQTPADKVRLFDLKPVLDARCGVCSDYPCSAEVRKYCRGNRAARQRMAELFDWAGKNRGVVCGTENFSEYMTGYFTLHGDEASNVEPIHGLTKTEVRLVAMSYKGFPAQVVSQPPSANLWKGQTDETELGFSYEELDAYILSGGNLEVAEYLGIDKATWTRIFERIDGTEFKRRDKPTWGANRRLGERLTLA